MDLDDDLRRVAKQEERLRFKRFDLGSAWELGTRLKALAESRNAQIVIDIRLAHESAFFYAMPGTTKSNADWARRKRNVVEFFHRSSYAIGLAQPQDGETALQRTGLPVRDYAAHGGGFPLLVEGLGCVGAVAISGLPQRDDHMLVVEAIAQMCGVPLAKVQLP